MGDESVVPRVEHGRVEKAVDLQCPGVLVQLVFDGHPTEWDLYEGVDLLRRIATGSDFAEIHDLSRVHAPTQRTLGLNQSWAAFPEK
jgi:hypothetical protein